MADPTYANPITPQEVTLALEHLLIAPAGTAWTPGRVTVDAPPPGFIHLGAVADDSPSMSAGKQTYDLSTGIPSVLQYQAVVALSGQIGMVLHTFDNYAMYLAAGGLPPYLMPKTTASVWGTVSPTAAETRTSVVVSTPTPGPLFAINDLVVTDTTAALNTSRNYAWITAVSTSATAWTLTLQGTGLPFTPVASASIVSVAFSRLAMGTNVLPEFHLLGVADALNGMQIVHDCKKARPTGEITAALRNGAHIQVPVSFNLLGYTVDSPYSSAGQLIVSESFIFMPSTVA